MVLVGREAAAIHQLFGISGGLAFWRIKYGDADFGRLVPFSHAFDEVYFYDNFWEILLVGHLYSLDTKPKV